MKKFFIIVAAIITAFIIMAVVVTSLLVGGANEVVKELDKQQAEHSITQSEFRSLELGTSLDKVKKKFGAPADTQKFETKGLKDITLYYNVEGSDAFEQYQLVFENGRLTSKSKF